MMQYLMSTHSSGVAVPPSPTSHALLGLLSLRSWTTYELTQQAQRSLRFLYPRAERHLYAEAKKLAQAGLAKTDEAFTGKRKSTTYSITPAGRKALRDWLRSEPEPPVLEAEVLLRSFFGDLGRHQDLLAALETARVQAVETQRELTVIAQTAVDGVAPFPERAAVGALTMRFVADFHRLVEEWSTWAVAEVATWDDADGRSWPRAAQIYADIASTRRP
jgi:DNA-binding PadR family transcriptional regulator